ncbi:integumentary mucin C.1 [Drosophila santomea]|uniref:integumentary mucin C.1 n=1 Tax=Drosophila santomea TaxID=129105 RepID=UPI001954E86B|nr:integumentary mucin C.1 [Drosophila santomea]
MRSAVICLLFIATAAWAQDIKPEVPIYFTPPPIIAMTTESPVMTTISEETTTESSPTTTSTTESTTTTTTEISTTPTTEPSTTTSTTETTTTTAVETPTTTTTEPSTTISTTETTTVVTTTTAVETPTTTTTEPNPAFTTQAEPIYPIYPTYRPPYVRPTTSGRPPYYPMYPWSSNNGNSAVNCYLRNQQKYRKDCYGERWIPRTICYRCCYYDYNQIAGCSEIHRGRCSWYDHARWVSPLSISPFYVD